MILTLDKLQYNLSRGGFDGFDLHSGRRTS
jgi:hypothetical protein